MKIIGVCGKIGAGKDTVADYICRKYRFKKVVMSDIIIDELKSLGREVSREAMQKISIEFKAKYGKGIWAKKVVDYANEKSMDRIVVTGIRDSEEIPIFKKEDFILIFVDADTESRFGRLVRRKTKKDFKTPEELKVQESKEAEIYDIYEIFEKISDVVIDNSGSIEDLKRSVNDNKNLFI